MRWRIEKFRSHGFLNKEPNMARIYTEVSAEDAHDLHVKLSSIVLDSDSTQQTKAKICPHYQQRFAYNYKNEKILTDHLCKNEGKL